MTSYGKFHNFFLAHLEMIFNKISTSKLRSLPVKVTDPEIDEMFRVADVDRDGKIGYKVNIKTKNIVFFL